MSSTPRIHCEQEDKDTIAFSVELTPNGQQVLVKGRNGTVFLRVDFLRKECTLDVLNVPHIDVASKKRSIAAIQQAQEAAKEGPKTKKVKIDKD
jgi:hypothetical protein